MSSEQYDISHSESIDFERISMYFIAAANWSGIIAELVVFRSTPSVMIQCIFGTSFKSRKAEWNWDRKVVGGETDYTR